MLFALSCHAGKEAAGGGHCALGGDSLWSKYGIPRSAFTRLFFVLYQRPKSSWICCFEAVGQARPGEVGVQVDGAVTQLWKFFFRPGEGTTDRLGVAIPMGDVLDEARRGPSFIFCLRFESRNESCYSKLLGVEKRTAVLARGAGNLLNLH